MNLEETDLPGVVILTPARHGDHRGFFSESWKNARMEAAGLHYEFVQDNHSLSAQVGTVRGLHFQSPPARPSQAGALWKGASGLHQHYYETPGYMPVYFAVENIQRSQGATMGYLIEMGVDPGIMIHGLTYAPFRPH